MSRTLEQANEMVGERMAAALAISREQALEHRQNIGVGDLGNAWVGTGIDVREVNATVAQVATYTLQQAEIEFEMEDKLWRTVAGVVYRSLLMGVLAAEGERDA